MSTTPSTMAEIITDIYGRVAELERRARNRRRKGVVAEIGTGANAGKYRVRLSEQGEKPYLTGWVKPRQLAAGGVKIDVLYSQDEQVDVVSESGDLADAQIDFSTYSDSNQRENDDTPLHIKIGETVIAVSGDTATVTAATVIVNSPNVHLGGEGGKRVARIGDKVNVSSGSSSGLWPIVEGSSKVFAVD